MNKKDTLKAVIFVKDAMTLSHDDLYKIMLERVKAKKINYFECIGATKQKYRYVLEDKK